MAVRILHMVWRSGVLGRCPNCGLRPMFEGFYELHHECEHCGLRFEAGNGAWLGGIAIGYGFGALFVILAAGIELAWSPLRSAGLDPLYAITIAALPVTALAYRPAKGIWFGLLYLYGLIRVPAAR